MSGIGKRRKIDRITRVSRQTLEQNGGTNFLVDDYSNLLDHNLIIESIKESQIFIIAFGFLELENEMDFNLDLLRKSISINTFDVLKCVQLVRDNHNSKEIEIHVTSSILADIIRPSLFSYSISKNILSNVLERFNSNVGSMQGCAKLFHWKFSFVPTKLNSGRKKSIISTSINKIDYISSIKSEGGEFYVPNISRYLVKILSWQPWILKIIDRRS